MAANEAVPKPWVTSTVVHFQASPLLKAVKAICNAEKTQSELNLLSAPKFISEEEAFELHAHDAVGSPVSHKLKTKVSEARDMGRAICCLFHEADSVHWEVADIVRKMELLAAHGPVVVFVAAESFLFQACLLSNWGENVPYNIGVSNYFRVVSACLQLAEQPRFRDKFVFLDEERLFHDNLQLSGLQIFSLSDAVFKEQSNVLHRVLALVRAPTEAAPRRVLQSLQQAHRAASEFVRNFRGATRTRQNMSDGIKYQRGKVLGHFDGAFQALVNSVARNEVVEGLTVFSSTIERMLSSDFPMLKWGFTHSLCNSYSSFRQQNHESRLTYILELFAQHVHQLDTFSLFNLRYRCIHSSIANGGVGPRINTSAAAREQLASSIAALWCEFYRVGRDILVPQNDPLLAKFDVWAETLAPQQAALPMVDGALDFSDANLCARIRRALVCGQAVMTFMEVFSKRLDAGGSMLTLIESYMVRQLPTFAAMPALLALSLWELRCELFKKDLFTFRLLMAQFRFTLGSQYFGCLSIWGRAAALRNSLTSSDISMLMDMVSDTVLDSNIDAYFVLEFLSNQLNFGPPDVRRYLHTQLDKLSHMGLALLDKTTADVDSDQFAVLWNFVVNVMSVRQLDASARELRETEEAEDNGVVAAAAVGGAGMVVGGNPLSVEPAQEQADNSVNTAFLDAFLYNRRQLALLASARDKTDHLTDDTIQTVISIDQLKAMLGEATDARKKFQSLYEVSQGRCKENEVQITDLQEQLERARRTRPFALTPQASVDPSISPLQRMPSQDAVPEVGRLAIASAAASSQTNEDTLELLSNVDPETVTAEEAKEFISILHANRSGEQGVLGSSLAGALRNLAGDELYSSPAHFMHEFMQNADDAAFKLPAGQVPTMFLQFRDGAVIIASNERGLRPKDVLSMCRIGVSTKMRDGASTGNKGLGFKSIFSCTTQPSVVSGEFQFRFVEEPGKELTKITPCWIDDDDFVHRLQSEVKEAAAKAGHTDGYQWNTIFHIPLDKAYSLEDESFYQDLLQSVNQHSLLFTRNIKRIILLDANGHAEQVTDLRAELPSSLQTWCSHDEMKAKVLPQPTATDEQQLEGFLSALSTALYPLALAGKVEVTSTPMLLCKSVGHSRESVALSECSVFRLFKFRVAELAETRVTFAVPFLSERTITTLQTAEQKGEGRPDDFPAFKVHSVLPVCDLGFSFLFDANFDIVASREKVNESQRNTHIRDHASCVLAQILGRDALLQPLVSVMTPTVSSSLSPWWRVFVAHATKELKLVVESRLCETGVQPCINDSRICPALVSAVDLREFASVKVLEADQLTLERLGFAKVSIMHVARCFSSSPAFRQAAASKPAGWWQAVFELAIEHLASPVLSAADKDALVKTLCATPMFTQAISSADGCGLLPVPVSEGEQAITTCFIAHNNDFKPWRTEFRALKSRCEAEDVFLSKLAFVDAATPALMVEAIVRLHVQNSLAVKSSMGSSASLGSAASVWKDLQFLKEHYDAYASTLGKLTCDLQAASELSSGIAAAYQPLCVPVLQGGATVRILPAKYACLSTLLTVDFTGYSDAEATLETAECALWPVYTQALGALSPDQIVPWEEFLLKIGCSLPPAPAVDVFAASNTSLFPGFAALGSGTEAGRQSIKNLVENYIKKSARLVECFHQVRTQTVGPSGGAETRLFMCCKERLWAHLPQIAVPLELESVAAELGVHVSLSAALLLCALEQLGRSNVTNEAAYLDCLTMLRQHAMYDDTLSVLAKTVQIKLPLRGRDATQGVRLYPLDRLVWLAEVSLVGPLVRGWLDCGIVSPTENTAFLSFGVLLGRLGCHVGIDLPLAVQTAAKICAQDTTIPARSKSEYMLVLEHIEQLLRGLASEHHARLPPSSIRVPQVGQNDNDSPQVHDLVSISWRVQLRAAATALFDTVPISSEPNAVSVRRYLHEHLPLISSELLLLPMSVWQNTCVATLSKFLGGYLARMREETAVLLWEFSRNFPLLLAVQGVEFAEEWTTDALRVFFPGGASFSSLPRAADAINTALQAHAPIEATPTFKVQTCRYFPTESGFAASSPFLVLDSVAWLKSNDLSVLAAIAETLLVHFCPSLSREEASNLIAKSTFAGCMQQAPVTDVAGFEIPYSKVIFPISDTLDGAMSSGAEAARLFADVDAAAGAPRMLVDGAVQVDRPWAGPQFNFNNGAFGGFAAQEQQDVLDLQRVFQDGEGADRHDAVPRVLDPLQVRPHAEQVARDTPFAVVDSFANLRTGRNAEAFFAVWLAHQLGAEFSPVDNWLSSNRLNLFGQFGRNGINDAAGYDFMFNNTRNVLVPQEAGAALQIPTRVFVEVKGCRGEYGGTFFMSANELETNKRVISERKQTMDGITNRGLHVDDILPTYVVVVIEHAERLGNCSFAAVHVLNDQKSLVQKATTYAVSVQARQPAHEPPQGHWEPREEVQGPGGCLQQPEEERQRRPPPPPHPADQWSPRELKARFGEFGQIRYPHNQSVVFGYMTVPLTVMRQVHGIRIQLLQIQTDTNMYLQQIDSSRADCVDIRIKYSDRHAGPFNASGAMEQLMRLFCKARLPPQ